MKWPYRFLELFSEIEDPLAVVLKADGCRENWLQGEFFRRFHEDGLRTNQAVSGLKHDLYCDIHPRMVAEIKIYTDDIKRHRKQIADLGPRLWLLADIESLGPATGSYLADVLRLLKLSVPEERYMVLVLPVANDRVISNLHVVPSDREIEKVFRAFRVRISMLHDV
jgi:hypothetical protein